MLSDEEKKEYEELKSLLYTGTISQYGKRKLIDIIEKQSKEIEELKEEQAKRQWVHIKENGEVEPLFYISKDKIKAKIEEYEKNKKILEERKNGVFYSVEEIDKVDRNIKFYDVMINEMQSLLEKE